MRSFGASSGILRQAVAEFLRPPWGRARLELVGVGAFAADSPCVTASTSPSLARRVAFGLNDQVAHDFRAGLVLQCAQSIEHRNHWLWNPQEQFGNALSTLAFTVSLPPLCG